MKNRQLSFEPLMHLSTRLSLDQSSTLAAWISVFRNAIAVKMSGRTCFARCNSFATRSWNLSFMTPVTTPRYYQKFETVFSRWCGRTHPNIVKFKQIVNVSLHSDLQWKVCSRYEFAASTHPRRIRWLQQTCR